MLEPSAAPSVKMGSAANFGYTFAVVLGLIGLWPLWHHHTPRVGLLVLAWVFLLAAKFAPDALQPLNRLWFKFGMALSKVMTPLIMGLLYLLAIVPVGLLRQALGHDPLRLKLDPKAETYWQARTDKPAPMNNQF